MSQNTKRLLTRTGLALAALLATTAILVASCDMSGVIGVQNNSGSSNTNSSSADPSIEKFTFEAAKNAPLENTITGEITGNTIQVRLPKQVYNADPPLVPTIKTPDGASVSPTGPQHFADPVTYTVKAGGSSKTYTVRSESTVGVIMETFTFEAEKNDALSSDREAVISGTTVSVTLPYSVINDKTALRPTITTPEGVSIEPKPSKAQSFDVDRTYTLSKGGVSTDYTVKTSADPNTLTMLELGDPWYWKNGKKVSITTATIKHDGAQRILQVPYGEYIQIEGRKIGFNTVDTPQGADGETSILFSGATPVYTVPVTSKDGSRTTDYQIALDYKNTNATGILSAVANVRKVYDYTDHRKLDDPNKLDSWEEGTTQAPRVTLPNQIRLFVNNVFISKHDFHWPSTGSESYWTGIDTGKECVPGTPIKWKLKIGKWAIEPYKDLDGVQDYRTVKRKDFWQGFDIPTPAMDNYSPFPGNAVTGQFINNDQCQDIGDKIRIQEMENLEFSTGNNPNPNAYVQQTDSGTTRSNGTTTIEISKTFTNDGHNYSARGDKRVANENFTKNITASVSLTGDAFERYTNSRTITYTVETHTDRSYSARDYYVFESINIRAPLGAQFKEVFPLTIGKSYDVTHYADQPDKLHVELEDSGKSRTTGSAVLFTIEAQDGSTKQHQIEITS
jgi:hypothetical protein